jgi:hypothetical protein
MKIGVPGERRNAGLPQRLASRAMIGETKTAFSWEVLGVSRF